MLHDTKQLYTNCYVVSNMETKQNQKESGWKVYDWTIVGGFEIIAKNTEDAEMMAEQAAAGAWDLLLESETPVEEASVSMAAIHDDESVGIDWANWDKLSPQAKRAIRNLVDKMAKEKGYRGV